MSKKLLPKLQPCTCGEYRSIDMENWRDMNKIITCANCKRRVIRDTWREVITAWNEGL